MNPRIEKLEKDIEATKVKIEQLQNKLQRMENKKTELENAEYIAACRSYRLSPAELYAFLQSKQLPSESESGTDETEESYED